MTIRKSNFFRFSLALLGLIVMSDAYAAQAPNPRSGGAAPTTSARGDGRDARRVTTTQSAPSSMISRASTRRGAMTSARGAASNIQYTSVAARSTVRPLNVVSATGRGDASTARSAATTLSRSAMPARTAGAATTSRAAAARATAVFDDISKIGGGYAQCREAYATCMDQFCAKANETYRRCFCSTRFTEFRDTELALDQAKTLLMQFEDNSLNAVDKTAAEVNAMYSATVGELAIKKDTSAAQATLNEISELLSGKKKASTNSGNLGTSLGVLSFGFSDDIDDIWSGDGDSLFSDSGQNLAELEGQQLFNSANKQCLKMITDSCESNAVLNMAKSSYNILITQDCNAYEKKVNSQREAVTQTVRQAEKILRDARLEEYRTHNSADVNECLDKVRSALTTDVACGAGYKRCLDYSGAYINQTSGEPIYSPRLFELTDMIILDGNMDVLSANSRFNQFLDTKRMFATAALDTCRDMADTVWMEFKRAALIEIAQAQDEKIEEVKMSCVSTMAECYDTQSNALKSFDKTTAQASGALAAYASRAMCQDRVAACAALYGGTDACDFGTDGKLKNAQQCGLPALLKFVENVDSVRVAEGCATAIDNYVKQLCTPASGTQGYPWQCRLKPMGSMTDAASGAASASLVANIKQFAVDNCSDVTVENATYDALPVQTRTQVENLIQNVSEELDYRLMEECEKLDGYWLNPDEERTGMSGTLLAAFYSNLFNGTRDDTVTSLGKCIQNDTMLRCLSYNEADSDKKYATYDRTRDECTFTDEWYRNQCSLMGSGYFENGVCYVAQ